MRLALVGMFGGTHLGGSFSRAAERIGVEAVILDANDAFSGPRLLRTLSWRLMGHRPPRLGRFSEEVAASCLRSRPDILIALGTASLTRTTIEKLSSAGTLCMTFCSDDPFNKTQRADWHLAALPAYRVAFTPRRANLADLRALGCPDVRYLPFGYDEALFGPCAHEPGPQDLDVLFVGGADGDRVQFIREFLRSGLRMGLVGGYWDRFPEMQPYALGFKTPEELCTLSATAKVNLCLVRKANRDGHVMRSFEIAAVGGCMLAEDTDEHREIFGPEGETVLYFRNAGEASTKAAWLLSNAEERFRMAQAVRKRAGGAENTYRARLATMLETANALRGSPRQPAFMAAAQ
jgi:spore maturation protein CgeB